MRHSAGLRRDSNLVSSYEELEKLLDHDGKQVKRETVNNVRNRQEIQLFYA